MREEQYRAMFELEERLWWFVGMREVAASILAPEQIEHSRVLDVGCGTGFSLLWLKERLSCEEIFGVDRAWDAAQFWQLRRVETAVVAGADALPFGGGKFDLITCFDVIYQFQPDQARRALDEMHRTLKPGGLLFIREPAYEWMRGGHDVAVGTCHRYTRRELRRALERSGFSVKRASYANALLFWLAAAHRWLSRIRGSEASDVKPVPPLINRAMAGVLKIEARLLRGLNLPFGLSVVALAEKKK
jgi:SAM-dependent methyltransferase